MTQTLPNHRLSESLISPSRCRVTLLCLGWVTLLLLLPDCRAYPQSVGPDHLALPSGHSAELEHQLGRQHAAVQSGDAVAIEETTRGLSALALRQLGDLRRFEHLMQPAVELYRRSLALQDSETTRADLAQAEGPPNEHQSPGTSKAVDPAAQPTAQQLFGFSATQVRQFSQTEDRLREILGGSFNDWGTLEARQQRYETALIYLHEAEDWDAATPGLLSNIGAAAFHSGQYREAARAFELVALRDPTDQHARLMLAMSQFSCDNFAAAAESFSHIPEPALQDPRAAYAWALSLARTEQQAAANRIVDELSSRQLPLDQLSLVCKVYDETANYEQSVKCFQRISQQDPSFQGSHLEAGAALVRLDRPAAAIPELQAELSLSPDNRDAQYYLAYALLQVSRKDEAARLLQAIVAADPTYVQAQYQLGKLLLEQGQIDQAVQHLEAAARQDQDHDYLHYQLEVAYRRAGRTADADRELKLYKEIKTRKRQGASVHESALP